MKKIFYIAAALIAALSIGLILYGGDTTESPTPPNNLSIDCAPEQRDVEACIAVYQPVCAKINIQCITSPCLPLYETLSNSCEACKNSLAESYTEGECSDE